MPGSLFAVVLGSLHEAASPSRTGLVCRLHSVVRLWWVLRTGYGRELFEENSPREVGLEGELYLVLYRRKRSRPWP